MNRVDKGNLIEKLLFKLSYYSRYFEFFSQFNFLSNSLDSIDRIIVLNLDRKQNRWKQMKKELKRIKTKNQRTLYDITRRFSAIDAKYLPRQISSRNLITTYTLANQLAVEPTNKLINNIDANSFLIEMTPQEIAIALSHIEIWKLITTSHTKYTLILEDDVFFNYNFAKKFDNIWRQINRENDGNFDILFLSYEYAKDMSNKIVFDNASDYFTPVKGIWQASGYILSKQGALKLINLLPVYGPVDLWLNLVFDKLLVYMIKRPIISQRYDVPSTNSYSIMPIFSKLGIYNEDYHTQYIYSIKKSPVFVFGTLNSKSISVALMILGYTCCYNLNVLPKLEEEVFWNKARKNHFNAYVNILSFENINIKRFRDIYPSSMIIILDDFSYIQSNELTYNTLFLSNDSIDKWEELTSFLDIEYPTCPFPDFDNNETFTVNDDKNKAFQAKELEFDNLPWILKTKKSSFLSTQENISQYYLAHVLSSETKFDLSKWTIRNDTFPSNLSLFHPDNLAIIDEELLELQFKIQETQVRSFTSAAIATKNSFLYGRFIVELCPPKVDGIITGIFLHRNSPQQEIDIEFLGKDTTKMLINVFFNPGVEGTKLEYGYRGTPVLIDLGFDASEKIHKYEIRWSCNFIKWYVDDKLVYERGIWSPTPIPFLPMQFNVNLWNSRSKELAGLLDYQRIPTVAKIRKIMIMNDSNS